jgi:hypothetical protein
LRRRKIISAEAFHLAQIRAVTWEESSGDMWWLGALELVGFDDSWWHELLGFSINPCNTAIHWKTIMFEALPVSSAHIGHHLDILARQLPLDTSTTQASWFRWWSRNTLQRTSMSRLHTSQQLFWDTLSIFKLFWVWNIEHIEHTGKCKSHTVLPFLRIFFTTSLSQIRLILESCLICVASVVGNTLKSSKIHDPPSFPTFSHHFPIIFQHLPYANGIISLSVCRFSGFRLARRKACGIPSANTGISTGHL